MLHLLDVYSGFAGSRRVGPVNRVAQTRRGMRLMPGGFAVLIALVSAGCACGRLGTLAQRRTFTGNAEVIDMYGIGALLRVGGCGWRVHVWLASRDLCLSAAQRGRREGRDAVVFWLHVTAAHGAVLPSRPERGGCDHKIPRRAAGSRRFSDGRIHVCGLLRGVARGEIFLSARRTWKN